MPVGTPFDVTNRHAERLVAAALELQEKYTDPETGQSMITNILSSVGAGGRNAGSHLARIQVETVPRQDLTIDFSVAEMNNEWRRLAGRIPGAESLVFRASYFRAGDPIDIQFSGNSLETLNAVGEEVKKRLATYPGVFEIADSLSDGKEELQIELSPQGHVTFSGLRATTSSTRSARLSKDCRRSAFSAGETISGCWCATRSMKGAPLPP